MRYKPLIPWALILIAGTAPIAKGGITLGTAGDFAVLAGSTVTNTGPTSINGGNVGVSPGTAITGFPPGSIAAPYTTYTGGPVAAQAESDLAAAYGVAQGLGGATDLSGQNLGGLTLTPGVYSFASTAQLTGVLTLNDEGNPNAQFVFQIGTTLATAVDASVITVNGGASSGANVFWQVGSSATLGAGTDFEGHILAYSSITLDIGATIEDGSALAINGAVSLDSNSITNAIPSSVPEPGSFILAIFACAVALPAAIRTKLRHGRTGPPIT
jgi:type VI secretion system secreted protein VgrG